MHAYRIGLPYYASEYIPRRKLWQNGRLGRLRRFPLGRPPPGAVTVSENIFQNIRHRDIYIPESILSNVVLHNICIQKYLDVEIFAYYNIVVLGNTSKGNNSENRIGKNICSCRSRDA